jgi:ferric-dicitrate binding protein FerR (iron transport regulator)
VEQFYENRLSQLLHKDRLPFKQDKASAWEAVRLRIAAQDETPVYHINRAWSPLRVAAALVALVGAAALLVILTGNVAIDGRDGAITETNLPDGSEVTIKGEGHLSFNKWLWSFDRSVSLEGEAFFDVVKGSTFTVDTESGSVEVLGTSFTVLSMDDRFEVACKTGRVRVNHESGAALELKPGDAAIELEENLIARNVHVQSIGVWAIDDLIFENIPASELFDALGRATGYHFVIKAKLDMTYSGQFGKEQSIEDILNIVCLPMNLNYELVGEEVIITNK